MTPLQTLFLAHLVLVMGDAAFRWTLPRGDPHPAAAHGMAKKLGYETDKQIRVC